MNLVPDLATLFLPFVKTSWGDARSLRVGIVYEGNQRRPWVDALISFLKQIPGIDLHVFHADHRRPPEGRKPPAWLLERFYAMSRSRCDPFGDAAMDGAVQVAPEAIETIRSAGCEVILWLAPGGDPGIEPRGLAKHAFFTVRFGDRPQTIPYWDEISSGSATSPVTILWHDLSFAEGRSVCRAETSAEQGLFITTKMEQPVAAAIRMFAALCLEIQSGGQRFEERVRGLAPQPLAETARDNCSSNLKAARFIVSKLARSAYLRWSLRGKTAKWFIALRPNRGDSIADPARLNLDGFREVPLPANVDAMADPFIWENSGRQYLLFEEVAAGQSRGRLGCVELLRDGSYSDMQIILDRPYHLSYPCVVPANGDLFLLPETAQAKAIELYRFRRFPWKVELVSSPIEGVALVDTTPVLLDGHWYFFTTTPEPFMETLLFHATRLEGPWSLHPCNPVSTSVRSCRSAGHLFWRDGRLFRPTQDCSVRYGYAIVVNEVGKLTPAEFVERPVTYIEPRWMPGLLGTHTWNESSAFQVIDGVRYSG